MTEAESPQSAKAGARRPGRPSFAPVFWGSLALFAVLFAVLTYQMSTASAPQAAPVVVRKVIKRRIVTTIVPGPGRHQRQRRLGQQQRRRARGGPRDDWRIMSEHDVTFDAMGSHVRFLIGEPGPGMDPAPQAAERARALRRRVRRDALALQAGERAERAQRRPARVRAGVRADANRGQGRPRGRRAKRRPRRSDPRRGDRGGRLRRLAGGSRRARRSREALAEAPPRQPAAPRSGGSLAPGRRRRRGRDDLPPARGCGFDTGGAGKGLAADLVAAELRGYSRFIVDCGGDIRIGGADALVNPYEVFVEHPLTGERAHVLRLGIGGVATSGLNVRIWRDAEGRFAHHLLDPASGKPAWTGLVGVTALGDTAVEAETLSKAALLSGPERGREVLAEHGGLLVHDSGRVEPVGPLAVKPRVRLPEQAGRAVG